MGTRAGCIGLAAVAAIFAAWMGPAALTSLVAILFGGYALQWQRKLLWWAPFALVAITLACGVRFA